MVRHAARRRDAAIEHRSRVTFVGARVATLIASLVLVSACSSGSSTTNSSSTSGTGHRTSTTTTTSTSTTTTSPPDMVLAAPLLPLFPFQTQAEAKAWRTDHRSSGARPEFADPGRTALAFAQFLGYTEVDHVIATQVDEKGRHVAIGSLIPDTDRTTTAAVVHLVRYMAGADAPWEVVGTVDTDFGLTTPAYGATIRSPLTVSGHITGVDENIKVHVQQLHAPSLLGELCCIPAGGQDSLWTGSITFTPPTDSIVMVSASTGGHILAVERFTVNGVRAG